MTPSPIPSVFRGCCKTSELLVGAVKEAVNECEASNSPPDIGGVAAPSRKRCEATAAAQTGAKREPAPLTEASRPLLDVASTPPMSGGEWRTRFIHTCIHHRPTKAPSCVLQQPLSRRGMGPARNQPHFPPTPRRNLWVRSKAESSKN